MIPYLNYKNNIHKVENLNEGSGRYLKNDQNLSS